MKSRYDITSRRDAARLAQHFSAGDIARFKRRVPEGRLNLNSYRTNSFTGFKGVSFKTGNDPVTVVKLGRYRFNGRPAEPGVAALPANSKKHLLILQKDKAAPKDAGAQRSEWVATGVVDCSQSSTEGFQYVTLENPVTLEPNTQYYLASYEESSEYFYDRLTIEMNYLDNPFTNVTWLGKYNYTNIWTEEDVSPDKAQVNLIVK